MKAPVSLPGVKKGEEVPPSGVSRQAVLGFLMPFLAIILAGIVVYLVIHAKLQSIEVPTSEGGFLSLFGW